MKECGIDGRLRKSDNRDYRTKRRKAERAAKFRAKLVLTACSNIMREAEPGYFEEKMDRAFEEQLKTIEKIRRAEETAWKGWEAQKSVCVRHMTDWRRRSIVTQRKFSLYETKEVITPSGDVESRISGRLKIGKTGVTHSAVALKSWHTVCKTQVHMMRLLDLVYGIKYNIESMRMYTKIHSYTDRV